VADAVHAEDGSIVMQLMHCGRASVRANKEPSAEAITPSAAPSIVKIPVPDRTPQKPEQPTRCPAKKFAVSSPNLRAPQQRRAVPSLDGVELHCASGYSPMLFLPSNFNLWIDDYGESVADRIRFAVEALHAMPDTIGADRVGSRICPGRDTNGMNDADPKETYAALIKAVAPLGLAYLHLIRFALPSFDPLALVKANWKGPHQQSIFAE